MTAAPDRTESSGDPDIIEVLARARHWPSATASLAVVRSGGMVAEWGPTSHVFALASVTKLFSALAVLVAVEEGTLELDEPAGPAGSTVRHLLAHASGLGPDSGVLAGVGERRIYSNAGFDALSDHLAERSGMAAVDYVVAAVADPLGLAHTTFTGPSLAHGLSSTVTDVARFAGELMRPTLVAPETMAAATTVQFPGLSGVLPGFGSMPSNDWGLGFEIRSEKSPHWTGASNSPSSYGHFGRSGTFLWIDPEHELALVALTNKVFGDWAKTAWPDVSDAVLEAAGGLQ